MEALCAAYLAHVSSLGAPSLPLRSWTPVRLRRALPDAGVTPPAEDAGGDALDAGTADVSVEDAGSADARIDPDSPEGRGMALYGYCDFAMERAARAIGRTTPTRWRTQSS